MSLSAGVRPEPPAGSSWWARAWGSGRGGSGTVGGTGWSEGPGGQQRGPGSEEEEAVGPFTGNPLMTYNVGYGRGMEGDGDVAESTVPEWKERNLMLCPCPSLLPPWPSLMSCPPPPTPSLPHPPVTGPALGFLPLIGAAKHVPGPGCMDGRAAPDNAICGADQPGQPREGGQSGVLRHVRGA